MRIVVVGLGHIGVVIVATLLRDGHVVVGVDSDQDIRDCVARGFSPFREPDVAGRSLGWLRTMSVGGTASGRSPAVGK